MMKKKLILAMAGAMMFASAFADTQTVDGVTWTYTIKDGQASVGGGSYTNTAVAKATAGSLTIPSMLGECPVTSIGMHAFDGCGKLTSVVVPAGVKTINAFAFNYCGSLESVTLPEGLEYIGSLNVFCGCSSLRSIVIPSTVTTLADLTFQSCTSLKSVTIPAGVTTLGDGVFSGCTSLEEIRLDGNPNFTVCAGLLCSKDGKTVLQCPGGLESVEIPLGITALGDYSFDRCMLKELNLPDGLETIGWGAISCPLITTLRIPASVRSVEDYQFVTCDSLVEITVDEDNQWYSSRSGMLTDKSGKVICHCPPGLTEAVIPDDVCEIANYAFSYGRLKKLRFPSSVTNVVGSSAFFQFGNGTVYVDTGDTDRVRSLLDAAGAWMDGIGFVEGPMPEDLLPDGDYTMATNGYTWAFTVLNGEATITDCDENPVGHVVIPGELGGCPVVAIGESLFDADYREDVSGLTGVTIPASVISIGDYAFWYCSSLKDVVFEGDPAQIEFGTDVFAGTLYSSGPVWNPQLVIEGGVVTGIEWVEGVPSCITADGLLVIPDGVTEIADRALCLVGWFTGVYLPESVMRIGDYAFAGCLDLEDVTFEDISSVDFISPTAFNGTLWKLMNEGWDVPVLGSSNGVLTVEWRHLTFDDYEAAMEISGGSLGIPEGVRMVPEGALERTGDVFYQFLFFPPTLESVGSRAFAGLGAWLGAWQGMSCWVSLSSTDISIACDAFGNDEEMVKELYFDHPENVFLGGWKVTALPGYAKPQTDTYPMEGNGAFLLGDGYVATLFEKTLDVGPGLVSEFTISNCSGESKAVLAGISNVTWGDFTSCEGVTPEKEGMWWAECLTYQGIVDVEKTAAQDADDYACYELPRINMAYWGGWISWMDYPSEDTVADALFRASSQEGSQGCSELPSVFSWVAAQHPEDFDAHAERPYCRSAYDINEFIVRHLKDGNALVELTTWDSSHGITCCGYEYDESLALEDGGYLTGLFIVDSDNDMYANGGGAAAPNRITYCTVEWDDEEKAYRIANIRGLEWDYFDVDYALWAKGATIIPKVEQPFELEFDGTAVVGFHGGIPEKLVLPEGITSIEESAFDADYNQVDGLVSVVVPEGVTNIAQWAFWGAANLTAVSLPASLVEIGSEAFSDCPSLTIVYVSPGDVDRMRALLEASWLDVSGITFVEGAMPSDIKPDGSYEEVVDGVAFKFTVVGGKASLGGGSNKATVVPTSTRGTVKVPATLGGCPVTALGRSAFDDCAGVTEVILPNGLQEVGSTAFRGCVSLQEALLPGSVKTVGTGAFTGCAALEELTLPNGLVSVGNYAFSYCKSVTAITVPATVTSIGYMAFEGCTGIESVRFNGDVPSGLANAGLLGTATRVFYPRAYESAYAAIVPAEKFAGYSDTNGLMLMNAVSAGRSVLVDDAWANETLDSRFGKGKVAEFKEKFGRDFAASLFKATGKVGSNGRMMTVFDDFLAGTDPTDADSKLQAKIEIGADGKPKVTWTPDLNEGATKDERIYRVMGAKNLGDEWTEVPSGNEADFNFFKVEVSMPNN